MSATPLWNPALWLVMPDGGSAVWKATLAPCGQCGREFALVERPADSRLARFGVQCGSCIKLKPGERVVGRVDSRTRRIVRD